MKTFFAIFCVFSAVAVRAAQIPATDGIAFQLQTTAATYDWRVSARRLLQTPEWNPEAEPIPLAPDKTCGSAGDWLRKHGLTNFVLETVQVVRCDRTSLSPQGKQLAKRFYYKLEYTKSAETMYAYVLLDGTLLEPKISPPIQRKK